MSSSPATFGGLAVDMYYQIRNGYYIEFAAMSINVHDIVITLDKEMDLLWKRQLNIASLAYLVNRYVVLILSVLNIVTLLDPALPAEECISLNLYTSIWSIPIIVTLIEALLASRVSVLFGNQKAVVICMWMLLLSSFVSTATLAGFASSGIVAISSPLPSVTGCFYACEFTDHHLAMQQLNSDGATASEKAARALTVIWIPCLFVEVTLVVLTVIKTYRHVRSAVQTPVLLVVLRDGCLYFSVIFAFMLLNAVFFGDPVLSGAYQTVFLQPELTISSVLCSRLFLNLRGVLHQNEMSDTVDSTKPRAQGPGDSEEHEMGDLERSWGETTSV